MNNKTSGFTESDGHNNTIDLATEVKRILEVTNDQSDLTDMAASEEIVDEETVDDYDDSKHVAKKVNLFRVRTIYGKTENLEYFYNDGSLTGDDLIGQLIRVIMLCEIVGIHIHVLVADAGGPNAPLFTALRRDRTLEGKIWLDDDLVSFPHPFFPGRWICICPCAVHGQKAFRNSLHKSQPGGPRNFVYRGTGFGWSQMKMLYDKDVANLPKQTRLSKQVLEPDRYSKMNVSEAVIPFESETIEFAFDSLIKLLPDCPPSILVRDSHVRELGGSNEASARGYKAEKLDRCLEILREEVGKRSDHSEYPNFLSHFCLLEYMVAVHGIFISRFLSTEAVLVDNINGRARVQPTGKDDKVLFYLDINEEEKRMKRYLEYLDDWYRQSLMEKEKKVKDWDKTFMSITTYKNARMTVCGFFRYARLVFALPNPPLYIPFSHAGQSSIENVFSRLRGMGRDTALTVPKGLLAQKVNRHLDTSTLAKGQAYDPQLVQASEDNTSTANIFRSP